MIRWGTCHFLSYASAHRYYRPYFGNDTATEVSRKIRDGEIKIGRDGLNLKPGDKLVLIDSGTRYAIESPE